MKKQAVFLVMFLFFMSVNCLGQKATITFQSDEDMTLRIYSPIDGFYNPYFISKKFDFKPNIINITQNMDIADFCFVKCEFSDGRRCEVIVQKNSNVEVDYINKQIVFKGDNAEGISYLNNNFIANGLGYYYHPIDAIFKRHVKTNIDFESIDRELQDKSTLPYLADLEKMKAEGKISESFASILSQELHYAYSLFLFFTAYQNLLYGNINGYKPTPSEQVQILKRIDQLIASDPINDNSNKYSYASYNDYYLLKYKFLDAETKAKIDKDYSRDIFGHLFLYMLAPDFLQKSLICDEVIYKLQNRQVDFDEEKVFAYIKKKFPTSEYLPIIRELIDSQKKIVIEKEGYREAKSVTINGKSIKSLQELTQVKGIKGNYVYIDLWASWCLPCKMQFKYNKDLHKLLSQYDKLSQVYISIDEDKNEPIWKKQIDNFQLSGYNFISSKALYNDISNKIYGGKSCTIPRYILLSPEGKILNSDLPRPAAMNQLKEQLDKVLKK